MEHRAIGPFCASAVGLGCNILGIHKPGNWL